MVGREQDFEGEYWDFLEKIISFEIILSHQEKTNLVKRLKNQGNCTHTKNLYKSYANEIESQCPTGEKKDEKKTKKI